MTLQRSSALASALLLIPACVLIGVTASQIFQKFIPHQFWDQWDFVSLISHEPDMRAILWDLIKPHNEHVILTSKILFWADYLLFDLTNALTIPVVNLAVIATAILLAFTAFPERLRPVHRAVLVVSCITAGWTLSQWENLVWGFQPQFILVLAFGLLAIRASVAWLDEGSRAPPALLAMQILLVALCVLSLSSGALIFLALCFVAVIRRASPGRAAAIVGPALLFFVLYLWWTAPRESIGDPGLRTAGHLLRFFLVMLGSPFEGIGAKGIIGAVLLCAASFWFNWAIVLPWWWRRPVDTPTLILGAFGLFIVAGLAGIAWGRTPLGAEAAQASRYCTPTTMLWLCLLLSLARHFRSQTRGGVSAPFAIPVIACAILGAGWAAGPRPRHLANLEMRHRQVVQSTYFVLAGIWSNEMIRPSHPDPDKVRPLLAYLQKRGLGIFSARSTLLTPDWSLLLAMNHPGSLDWCDRYSIDAVFRLGDDGWKINGWAQEPETLAPPAWLLAFDGTGRLRGFTPTMTKRPDLEHSLRAPQGMLGFSLPVGPAPGSDEGARTISIIIGYGGHAGSCRMEYQVRLPGPGENVPPPGERGPV